MKVLDRSINAWQLGILIFILLFANKILVLPSLLFEGAKMESLFALLFLCACEFGLVVLFYFAKKKFPTQSFSKIVREHLGNITKIMFYFLIMIFFLAKAVLLYNVTYIFFRNLIYKDTSNFLILFCFLPIINHLAICGLRVLGRTTQIFFPIIFGILFFCIVVGVFGINNRPLFFSSSFMSILETGARHISPFGDMMFLFLIMDRVEIKKGQWKIIFSSTAISLLFVFAINLVFMLSYTFTCFMHPYAIFEIMSFVKEYGGLGRIDIISMVLIILLAYFHLTIYLKCFMLSFHEVFRKIDMIYSVLSFNFFFIIIVVFFIVNLESAIVFGQEILPYSIILPYAILPIILLICCIKNKNIKNDNFRKIIKNNKKDIKNMQKNANFNKKTTIFSKQIKKSIFLTLKKTNKNLYIFSKNITTKFKAKLKKVLIDLNLINSKNKILKLKKKEVFDFEKLNFKNYYSKIFMQKHFKICKRKREMSEVTK